MISYYNGQLTDIMPGNITKKPEVKALSYALQQACRLLYRYSQRLYIYSNLDEQTEEVIDLLSSELRTQYYQSTLDIDTKRRLVKNTLIWYMKAGTPEAVEELVMAVFGEGEVKEWFEYGGKPYWFKIKTNAILTEDMNSFFLNMLQKVKNTRSHIQSIEIHRIIDQSIVIRQGYYSVYKPVAIMQAMTIHKTVDEKVYHGMQEMKVMHPSAIIMAKEQEE